MQELEKILEEMREASVFAKNHDGCVAECVTIGMVERILRKHMNDVWIPVEERLPKYKERCGNDDNGNQYMKRLEIAYMTDTIEYVHGYYDGYKWMDKYHDTIKNVVAWRIHDPYRPERSEE